MVGALEYLYPPFIVNSSHFTFKLVNIYIVLLSAKWGRVDVEGPEEQHECINRTQRHRPYFAHDATHPWGWVKRLLRRKRCKLT